MEFNRPIPVQATIFDRCGIMEQPAAQVICELSSTQFSQTSTPPVKKCREEIEFNRQKAVKRRQLMDFLHPMQKEALSCITRSEHTLIIMPTGSGKTSLVSSFKIKGKCSIVFAPYTLLVAQLAETLKKDGNAVAFPVEDDLVVETLILADYIIMPFESAPESADLCSTLYNLGRLGPIWIDEVRVLIYLHVQTIYSLVYSWNKNQAILTIAVQVHSICSNGRYREPFDSFWNLHAELNMRNISVKMIGLTATLRPDDVSDVLRRLSLPQASVFRRSCFRESLRFRFDKQSRTESEVIDCASSLAIELALEGKVLVFASTVKLCDEVAGSIKQKSYQGWVASTFFLIVHLKIMLWIQVYVIVVCYNV